jgi:hypothetical protein
MLIRAATMKWNNTLSSQAVMVLHCGGLEGRDTRRREHHVIDVIGFVHIKDDNDACPLQCGGKRSGRDMSKKTLRCNCC